MSKTKVIFRVWNDTGDVIAFFPDEIADSKGNCMSYMHVGQHGAADYVGLIRATRLATPSEQRALRQELESIGYKLDIKKRAS